MTRRFLALALVFFLSIPTAGCARRWDVLSAKEKLVLHSILAHWETWIPERKKEGSAPLMSFEELYAGLGPEKREFLDRVRAINPRKSFNFSEGGARFKRLGNQWIEKQGKREKLDPQYLPRNVHKAYKKMMKAMKKDLGKRLLVESGYRSPAYQLYTFLFYCSKHHYSLVETGHWVALPGSSEHGVPHRQAIDFINEKGINGDDPPQTAEDFERLPEYEWLQRNAGKFGFELSYPRGRQGTTFEPWHWRYGGKKETTST